MCVVAETAVPHDSITVRLVTRQTFGSVKTFVRDVKSNSKSELPCIQGISEHKKLRLMSEYPSGRI